MKVLLALHGFPPELIGGTESAVQSLARGLRDRGHQVVVVAGSMDHGPEFRRSADASSEDGIRVIRLHRSDLYFDHWQKSYSARASAAFAEVLAEERPDLVHVHHWIRLSRDLVATAARAGIPAAVTLHDYWASCLVTFRVRPDTKEPCDVPLGPMPCLACAAHLPPRTPWVSMESQMLALHQHRGDLARELSLARAVLAPTRAHAEAAAGFLGVDAGSLEIYPVPNGRDLPLERRARSPEAADAERGDGRLVLAAWGNLLPLKGFDVILRALAALPDPSRVALHLAGGEVLEDHTRELRALADGLDVTFHGAYQVPDLATHPVAGADLMVSGTRARESWGLVVDEACALGMPMVLPRAGAFPERLKEGEGVLFYPQSDERALAAVLQGLLDNPERLGALRTSLPELDALAPSQADHVERVLAVYGRVLAAGAPEVAAQDWWEARLRQAEEEQWDLALSQATPEELGFA
ncbi:MAG: glycosyltransferase [Planctomycetota bacterium]